MNVYFDLIKFNFISHSDTYDKSVMRDICDRLILAKNEAIEKSNETKSIMTDRNLSMSLVNLLIGGSETVVATLR